MKSYSFFILFMVFVFFFFLCANQIYYNESSLQTTTASGSDFIFSDYEDGTSLLECLSDHNFPVSLIALQNSPVTISGCSSQITFLDSRFSTIKDCDYNGIIELFVDSDTARVRLEYLKDTCANQFFITQNNNSVLMISNSFPLTYQKEYEAFFNVIQSFLTLSATPSPIPTVLPTIAPTATTQKTEAPKRAVHNASYYTAGTTIAAGEYVLLSETQSSYYVIYNNEKESVANIVSSETFTTTTIITLQKGQMIKLKNCSILPLDPSNPVNTAISGMFKIGTHLAAGTYVIAVDSPKKEGYYELCSDSLHSIDSIIKNDNFSNQVTLTLKDGEYLELLNAHLVLP